MSHSTSEDSHLLAGDLVYYGETPAPAMAIRKVGPWQGYIGKAPIAVDPAVCDVFPGNTRDLEALQTSPAYGELRFSMETIGQQIAAIARISKSDPTRLEIVAGASRITAIRQINDANPTANMKLTVDLRDLDDAEALKLVEGENAGRKAFTPLEKARLYNSALQVFGHAAGVADELGINKSTVSRTLDILRLPAELMSLISDHHKISAAQADEFMKSWNEELLRPTLIEAIAKFEDGSSSAPVVFKAMTNAIDPPKPTAVVPVLLKNAKVGTVRRTKNGGIRIELLPIEVGEHPFPLATAIGHALKKL